MKKVLVIIGILVLCVAIIGILIFVKKDKDSRQDNDYAQKDEKGRYLTIINNTNQTINSVSVTVGDGTEIEDMKQTNPDETSFSIPIPKQYSEYTEFTVTLVDRHDLKYEKHVTDVADKGRTEVVVSEDDYVKQKRDFWKKINKWFNGD